MLRASRPDLDGGARLRRTHLENPRSVSMSGGVPGVVELVRARRRLDDRRPVRALRRPGSFSGGSPAIPMTAL